MNNSPNKNFEEEIDFSEVFSVLLKNKKVISYLTIIFGIFSVVYTLSLPNIYQSESILVVAEGSSSSNESFIPSKFNGLATAAGISLPSSAKNRKGDLALETIRSRTFFKSLIEQEDIFLKLVASKQLKEGSSNPILDASIYDSKSSTWVKKPSVLDAYVMYSNNLYSTKDEETGFINLSFRHISPTFAYEFLSLVIDKLNSDLREKDLNYSKASLEYLNKQLAVTSQKETKNSIHQLIRNHMGILVLANVDAYYVLRPIEHPFIPEKKVEPRRSLICVVITLAGFLLGVIFTLVRYFVFQRDNKFS